MNESAQQVESSEIGVTINGEDRLLPDGTTVRGVLTLLNLPDCGVAVAIDGAVASQDAWDVPIRRGVAIDILTAVQGG